MILKISASLITLILIAFQFAIIQGESIDDIYKGCTSGVKQCFGKKISEKTDKSQGDCFKLRNCDYFASAVYINDHDNDGHDHDHSHDEHHGDDQNSHKNPTTTGTYSTKKPYNEYDYYHGVFRIQLVVNTNKSYENGYIGIGFSEDRKMGEDFIAVCQYHQEESQRYNEMILPTYSEKYPKNRPKPIVNEDLSLILKNGHVEHLIKNKDHYTVCTFDLREKFEIPNKNEKLKYYLRQDDKYFVLLAIGGLEHNDLAYHSDDKGYVFSSEKHFKGTYTSKSKATSFLHSTYYKYLGILITISLYLS